MLAEKERQRRQKIRDLANSMKGSEAKGAAVAGGLGATPLQKDVDPPVLKDPERGNLPDPGLKLVPDVEKGESVRGMSAGLAAILAVAGIAEA